MIPTALTEREKDEISSLASKGLVLEVGALLGASTIALAETAQRVHSVDPHEGYPQNKPKSTLKAFLRNLERAGVKDKVTVHLGYDYEVLPVMNALTFDMVFIDTTGLYEDTRRVMEASVRLLEPYGVMAVHDCGHPEWPGCERAVNDFALHYGTKYRQVASLAIFEQMWR